MYGTYGPTGSPPLPDIIGQYYAPTGYGLGVGPPPPPPSAYDMFGPTTSAAGYLYEPSLGSSVAAGLYGQHPSPIRRRRYSIAGLPSASMMNDYYGLYAPQMQQSSSSNIVNLLNEAHKSISRSSQILNQHARMQQATQPITPLSHYPGRIISSYPTLHPGDTSPPYLNDNLMQMSASFSSQPNMYFQQYAPTSAAATAAAAQQSAAAAAAAAAVAAQQAATGGHLGGRLLRPAYSVSNLNYLNYPSEYTSGGVSGIGGSSSYANPFSQSIFSQTDMPYSMSSLLQQRNLMPSLHASNPAISQYYQYATQAPHTHTHPLAYNLQQQFAGTQHYTHQLPPGAQHPSAHIHHSVQQQLNPLHQYHVHQQQHHMQTHPLAALRETSGPFAATLTSSALDDAGLTGRAGLSAGGGVGGVGGVATGAAGVAAASAYDSLHTAPSYQQHHHHQQQQQQQQHLSHLSQQQLHHHHHHHPTTSAPLSHTSTPYHHHQHMSPYSKLDLDYPKLPSEHKRQVSFKFDVDTLSLDS